MGLAAVQRITLMAKTLLTEGYRVTVICRKGVWKKNSKINFGVKGNYEGIDYIYTSESVFRPKGFISRNIQKLKGLYGEFMYLKYLKKHDKINVAIISEMNVVHVLRYLIYSAFLNFSTVINFVELASSMKDRNSVLTKVKDYLYDHWVIKLFDGALPISDRLMKYYMAIAPSKPAMKLPVLCDFEKFGKGKNRDTEPYFLYCGSMAYKEVIDFIIEAYKSISENETTKLFLIVSGGKKSETGLLQEDLNTQFNTEQIRLFSNIPYNQLVDLYNNAIALLIPLRPTVQDSARFPHKIGEYLASGNPVITTNVGEIKNYFEDGKTALVADLYDIDAIAEKMQYVLDNPVDSKNIGANGKQLGLAEFDYRTHGVRLRMFLQEI